MMIDWTIGIDNQDAIDQFAPFGSVWNWSSGQVISGTRAIGKDCLVGTHVTTCPVTGTHVTSTALVGQGASDALVGGPEVCP